MQELFDYNREMYQFDQARPVVGVVRSFRWSPIQKLSQIRCAWLVLNQEKARICCFSWISSIDGELKCLPSIEQDWAVHLSTPSLHRTALKHHSRAPRDLVQGLGKPFDVRCPKHSHSLWRTVPLDELPACSAPQEHGPVWQLCTWVCSLWALLCVLCHLEFGKCICWIC